MGLILYEMDQGSGEVTRLLKEWSNGGEQALDRLVPEIHRELRKLAAGYLRKERPDHTLQPTALVNEAFLKLIDQRAVRWQNRAHFFGIAAQAMRRILVDHARAHTAGKRGDGAQKVPLDDAMAIGGSMDIGLLALDEALTRLAAIDLSRAALWNCASSAASPWKKLPR